MIAQPRMITAPRPLRIRMLIFKYHPLYGGSETQARLLCRVLREKGHAVSVLTLRFTGLASKDVLEKTPIARVPHWPVPVGSNKAILLVAMFEVWRILLAEAHSFDIIHLHGASLLLIPAVLTGWCTGIPVIVKIATSGTIRGDLSILQRSPFHGFYMWFLRKANHFVCLNDESEREIREHMHVNSDRIARIPNGIDRQAWRGQSGMTRNDYKLALGLTHRKVAIFTGRFDVGKGVEVLLQAWQVVRATRADAHLLLVGDGPLLDPIWELIVHFGLQDCVTLTGATLDIKRYLLAADVFVLLSPNEGMSNALLEAMAALVPIVCSDTPGNRSLIQNGVNGLLVDSANTVQEAAVSINRLFADEQLALSLALQAQAQLEDRFDIKKIAAQYEQLYRVLSSLHTHKRLIFGH